MGSKVVLALLALVAFVVFSVEARNDAHFVSILRQPVGGSDLTTSRYGFAVFTLFQGSHTFAGYLCYNGPARAGTVNIFWGNSQVQTVARNFQTQIPTTAVLRGLNVHYFQFNATLVPKLTQAFLTGGVQISAVFNSTFSISGNFSDAMDTYVSFLSEANAVPALSAGNRTGAVGFGFFRTALLGSFIPAPPAAGFPLNWFFLPRRPQSSTSAGTFLFSARIPNTVQNSLSATIDFPRAADRSLVPEATNSTGNQRGFVLNTVAISNSRPTQAALRNGNAVVSIRKKNIVNEDVQAVAGRILPLVRLQGQKIGVSGGKTILGRGGNNFRSTWVRDSAAGSNVPQNYLSYRPLAGPVVDSVLNSTLDSTVFFEVPTNQQADELLNNPWPLHSLAGARLNYNIRLVNIPEADWASQGAYFLFNLIPQPNNIVPAVFAFNGFTNGNVNNNQRWYSGWVEIAGKDLAAFITADRKIKVAIKYYPGANVPTGYEAPTLGIDDFTMQFYKSNGETLDFIRTTLDLLPSVSELQAS